MATKICKGCGKINKANEKVCKSCGRPMSKREEGETESTYFKSADETLAKFYERFPHSH